MKWHLKVAAFKLLSVLPQGRALYQFSRKHFTQSLLPTPARVSGKIDVAVQYLNWLAQHQQAEALLKGVHLDFGSGWHPTIPLFLYSLGVERQYLFDVVPLMDGGLLSQTVQTYLGVVNEPRFPHRAWLRRRPPPLEHGAWRQYLEALGCFYHAPYAGVFPSLAGQVDMVTSTQVLLHVSRAALPGCLGQIYQSLKPGGLFLATLHLRDIVLGSFQTGLVKYRQLRYSPQVWEHWVNSGLMSFNRLKGPDYQELLRNAGFDLLHFQVEPGTAEELKELEAVPLAPCFQHYRKEDLAAHHLFFVAQRPGA